jgi:hypothetical protein
MEVGRRNATYATASATAATNTARTAHGAARLGVLIGTDRIIDDFSVSGEERQIRPRSGNHPVAASAES